MFVVKVVNTVEITILSLKKWQKIREKSMR